MHLDHHHPPPLDVVVMPGGCGVGPAATVGGKAASYTPVPLNPSRHPQQQSAANPKRGVCRQYGWWIALIALFVFLLIIAKAVDGQSTDPWAPYRHSLDEGYLKYPGPFTHTGVCGNNPLGLPGDMACGFYDPYPGMFLTGQSSCDASSTAASCLDEKCQIAYSCNMATPFAQCDSIVAGETCSSPLVPPGSTSVRPGCRNAACKCTDICATGPLCNLRRDTAFDVPTKFGVFPTLDCRSLSAGSIKELGVTTVTTPPPCSVFGPLGCNSATRACYRRFAVTEHIGDVCIPRNGWTTIPGVVDPTLDRFVGCTQSGVSVANGKDLLWGLHCDNGGTCPVEGMPCVCPAGFNGVFCTSALPCPRGWGGYRCQERVGCRNGGCDNSGSCFSWDTKCACPAGFGGDFCERKCPRGWTGRDCTENAKCFAGGCDNGGTCPGYGQLCTCPVGFGGDVCEIACPRGKSGRTCTENVGCQNGGCERGGTCPVGGAACVCPIGYGDLYCSYKCPRGMSGWACSIPAGCRSGGCEHGGTCYTEPGPHKDRCVACDAGWTGQYCERACGPGECDTALNGTWLPSRTIGQAIYPPGTCGITMACKAPFPGAAPAIFGTPGIDYPCGVMDSRIRAVYTFFFPPGSDSGIYVEGVVCNCVNKHGHGCLTGAMCDAVLTEPKQYAWTPRPTANYRPATQYTTANCSSPADVALALARSSSNIGTLTSFVNMSTPCRRHGPNGCNSTELACVRQTFSGTRPIQISNTTTVQLVPAMEICCPRGRIGDDCEIETGCTVHGCDNGGFCLDRDRDGNRLKPSDTRCLGCNPGTNGTAGWGGRFCNERMRPTWTWRYNLTGTGWTEGVMARRLLQAGVPAPEPILDRTTTDISRPEAGNIPREEGRICDCGVRWNHSVNATVAFIRTLPLMRFGNYESNPATQVLLSPMRFNPDETNAVSGFLHVARSHREAEYKCYLDASSNGYVEFNTTELRARGFFYFGCTFDTRHRRKLHGVARTDGQTMTGGEVAPLLVNLTGVRWHTIQRVPDAALCPDATLDPVFYCATYPLQCQSIRMTGGIGQIKIDAKTADNVTIAFLHYQMFGHRVRNQPNAQCNMGHTLLEDQQGCIFNMRIPDFIPPPLKPNETLSAERCGNLTWIVPERIGGSGVFPVGATAGTNVTDGGVPRCLCDAPFKPTGGNYTDCAFDMCGEGSLAENNTRGAINPLFEVAPLLDKCICKGIWQTDNATCEGSRCDWCNKAGCLNMGSPDLVDPTAACHCLPIFYGKRCELSYCNSTNTLQYAGTGPDIVCECKKGWTGPLCHQGACINGGRFNRDTLECVCPPAFTGGQCELPRCKPGYGTWSPEFGKCQCFAPWTGPRCEEHTCDDYNVVLADPDWNGMRPFGQPVLVKDASASLHMCQCNWPYKASAPNQAGRDLECSAHDCNHGVPRRGNSSTWPSNPLAAADMCECVDKAGIGILTDPKLCTEASHDGCPNACLRATCGLSQELINTTLHGQYVQVSSYDASCCECHASVGYQLNSTCQSWCAFYQPCVTTERSSFAPNPNYNASAPSYYKDDNITRVLDPANKQYLCACNTHYSNRVDGITGVVMNDCANYTQPDEDPHVNETNPNGGGAGDNIIWDLPESGKSSSGLPTTTVVGIAAASGFMALAGLAQWFSTASKPLGQLSSSSSSSSSSSPSDAKPNVTTTTTTIRTGGRSRRFETARLLSPTTTIVLMLLAIGVSAAPFMDYPDANMHRWMDGADLSYSSAAILEMGSTSCTCTNVAGSTTSTYRLPAKLVTHDNAPFVCGEVDPPNAFRGVGSQGRGKCWVGVGEEANGVQQTATAAYCWCNPDVSISDPASPGGFLLVPRRGWFGPKCETRTCTTRLNPIVSVPGPDGKAMPLELKAPLNEQNFPMQCSNHSHGKYSSQTNKYEDDGAPCADTTKREIVNGKEIVTDVNSDGRCKLCEDGWGLYPGYWAQDIDKTTFSKELNDQGICNQRTRHSQEGRPCGGYYTSFVSRVNSLPANGGGTVPIRFIESCTCGEAEGPLIATESGLCRRSCSGTTQVGRIPWEFKDANGVNLGGAGSMLLNLTSDFCGGYGRGLCRPIEVKTKDANGDWVGSLDGYNSACMCNAGYHGPNCVKKESMWYKGYVCGPDGAYTAIQPTIPAGSTETYIDEWWFNNKIAPLNGNKLRDERDAYSMFKCGCKGGPDGPVSRGWEPNADGICAPTCKSRELQGFNTTTRTNETCTGNGKCINDPTGKTAGMACECFLGWHGDNCATPILRDAFGAVCGGVDHGTIEYIDPNNKHSGGQMCRCNAGYGYSKDPLIAPGHARYGLCMRECPVSPKTGEPCTNQINGHCKLSANDNDKECQCTSIAFRGADCGIKLVASYTTKSKLDLPCTGRGIPDDIRMSGGCICDEGYTGFACEMYTGNRACGTGQCFQDNEAAEIFIS